MISGGAHEITLWLLIHDGPCGDVARADWLVQIGVGWGPELPFVSYGAK